MKVSYYSTNKKTDPIDFFTAILKGQAPDRGLYMPDNIPSLPSKTICSMSDMNYHQIAHTILQLFMEDPHDDLAQRCKEAYSFYPRLEKVEKNKHIMWLDSGPTASFKDFAAQMMSRLMGVKLKKDEKLLILTATSGDTGSAIAHAFHNIPNIEVIILFPFTEVSDNQRKQMTTLGGNIQAVAIDGKFDDGQAMVKAAFSDPIFQSINLTSANSINIARLIPQSVYYFWAYSRLIKDGKTPIIFSVPSGNFGDMMGSILAWKMGLPIKKLVIATNANDEFPNFLNTGQYQKIEPSKECISNAMNVGHPSNLARLVDIFGGHMDEKGTIHTPPDLDQMRDFIFSYSVNDVDTRQTIKDMYEKNKIILDPHGAVGWHGLEQYLNKNPQDDEITCVNLETANPAKFPDEINNILNKAPVVPPSLENLDSLEESYDSIPANYEAFRDYLINRENK